MLVEIEGTSFSTRSIDTNEFGSDDGYWRINDLPAGTYTIRYSKPRFGEVREVGVIHVGNGHAYRPNPITLGAIPNGLSVRTLKAQPSDTTASSDYRGIMISASVDSIPGYGETTVYGGVAVFIGKTREVSSDPRTHQYATVLESPTGTSKAKRDIFEYTGELNRAGFTSGDTAYVIGYPMSTIHPTYYAPSCYFDPILRRKVYTAFAPTPSNIASVVIP